MRRAGLLRGLALWAALSSGGGVAWAQDCAPVIGRVVSVEGSVEIQAEGRADWRAAGPAEPLCQLHTIRTGRLSRAAVALANDEVLRLDQESVVRLADIREEAGERSLIELIFGAFYSFSRRPHQVDVRTTHMNLAIRGTEFQVRAEAGQSLLTVLEGQVAASNPHGEIMVAQGGSAVARPGEAPRPYVLVRPRDAVQWALHYPPILTLAEPTASEPAALAEARRLAGAGNVAAALDALDRAPQAERDARVQLQRAALLLSVGRVEEARVAIDRASTLDPQAGTAHALRSVIDVAQNRKAEALENARKAVELSPDAGAPRIALSYAQQANFQLEAARDTLLEATARRPDDALAWARLAELWLMLGYRDRAREAAARAASLAPDDARVATVRGFADLAEFRTEDARAAFARAIAMAPADPLPRLGHGLARIRKGALEEGRRDLEAAVGLDPANALLRAYLGKAYFEEKRGPLAAEQYALAKDLDPLDPTAYLYDAIRKQTENRPVEALGDLQRSIALNDNRAVYRGRLQLDEDRAARGTSLARIYDDLGFLDLGRLEATRSLAFDPANASAHRFLSDIYGGVRRREIARVSELLQAQLLQNININPIQPSLSETNLNIITQGGPANPGFDEFTPLFERDRFQLNASGVIGNQNTFGGEAVASALYDRYSVSAGLFHYESDGFRANNDIDHDILNFFFQAAITPELNAQVELTKRSSDTGDLDLLFDPDDFSRNEKRDLDQDIARVGLRWAPNPTSTFLLSGIYSDREEELDDRFDTPDGPFVATGSNDDEGFQLEGQHIYRQDRFSLITGLALSNVDTDVAVLGTLGGVPIIDTAGSEKIEHRHGYIYGNVSFPESVTWTLGLSYDDFEQDPIKLDKLNPKLGVQWNVTDSVRLRAAAFQTVKPALVNNRTIEPTQVAGFNQLFDDANGDVSFRYGVGLDWRLRDNLFVGAEATWRDLDAHFIDTTTDQAVTADHEEQTHRLYLNWAATDRIAVSTELVYDRFEARRSTLTVEDLIPERVDTFSVPLRVRWFDPSGVFAGAGATLVHQNVRRSRDNALGLADGDDSFVVLDAAIGYRLPNRAGVVSLEVNNLLDNGFRYQDDSFREFRDTPTIGPFIPERQILLRLTLNW